MDEDLFASLDAEIKTITARANLKADAKELKRRANDQRLANWKRKEAAAEYHNIQAILEAQSWRRVAEAALFTEQHCDGCDTIHRTFLQYMAQEELISRPSTKRWIRLEKPEGAYPRETIVQPITTNICAACAAEFGFDVEAPNIRLMPSYGTLTVSSTYVQGDINEPSEED